ncbi:hypothetical protein AKJ65_02860 [candidate division MSBL1 archaeon SCGC-AAA259E19]|uniref:Uncharacterized protein n=1 Tax=candidate division MSBL1 archaeon SCGC-AAA259E19 TaxID=1698264 RepID=A0A133ULG3_9EURY|nr:hypothetical protein AKJ65_02860 [candidate division MSBL1 archaeon SCGC-AAA259E19]
MREGTGRRCDGVAWLPRASWKGFDLGGLSGGEPRGEPLFFHGRRDGGSLFPLRFTSLPLYFTRHGREVQLMCIRPFLRTIDEGRKRVGKRFRNMDEGKRKGYGIG